ncbi:hypothetical protein D3C71_2221200 [compost metagenome]
MVESSDNALGFLNRSVDLDQFFTTKGKDEVLVGLGQGTLVEIPKVVCIIGVEVTL